MTEPYCNCSNVCPECGSTDMYCEYDGDDVFDHTCIKCGFGT